MLYCKELNLNSNVSNKLPSGVVATENHDGRRRSKKYRKNGEKKKIESPPQLFIGKLWKNHEKGKKKKWSANQKRVRESVTRGEGISTPRVCPKTIPLIELVKSNVIY